MEEFKWKAKEVQAMRPYVGILLVPHDATIVICSTHFIKEVCAAWVDEAARESESPCLGLVLDLKDSTEGVARFIAYKMIWLGAPTQYAHGAAWACAKEVKRRMDIPSLTADGAMSPEGR